MKRYVVNGLDKVPLDFVSKSIAGMGFNCIRLPFSLEQFHKDPVVEDSAVSANPDLKGLTSSQIFDRTVKSLTDNGLMVILNNHMSNAGWCCGEDDGNGMWYNPDYPESLWISILE